MSEERGLIGAISKNVKHAKFAGIVMIIAGVLSIVASFVAGVSTMIVLGALLLVAGVAECFLAFKAGAFGRGLMIFLLGALTVVAGVLTLKEPITALATVTFLLAAYFFVAGIVGCMAALSARPEEGWGWLLASGLISILLGIMLWQQFPLSGIWAVGTLIGLRLIFDGVALFSIGSAVRKGVKGFTAAHGV
jgi:uncharacterized membrane protein HdeD (DUF308 family)